MAGQIKIETRFTVTDMRSNVKTYRFNSTFTGLTAISDVDFAITADQTRIIWDPVNVATENASDFDVLILVADGILDVELTVNEGDANEELHTFRLTKDTPLILGADDSYYNHGASNAFSGTLDVIDKIRVDEPESTAKNLRMILAS